MIRSWTSEQKALQDSFLHNGRSLSISARNKPGVRESESSKKWHPYEYAQFTFLWRIIIELDLIGKLSKWMIEKERFYEVEERDITISVVYKFISELEYDSWLVKD